MLNIIIRIISTLVEGGGGGGGGDAHLIVGLGEYFTIIAVKSTLIETGEGGSDVMRNELAIHYFAVVMMRVLTACPSWYIALLNKEKTTKKRADDSDDTDDDGDDDDIEHRDNPS